MSKYKYKFVEVPVKSGLKVKPGDTFEKCKKIIVTEAEDGWSLKQILTPYNEKWGFTALLAIKSFLKKRELNFSISSCLSSYQY